LLNKKAPGEHFLGALEGLFKEIQVRSYRLFDGLHEINGDVRV
jgi:hypothetical protein